MNNNIFAELFSYAFIIRALIVGVLVSLCSSLLGVTLVLKRYSMIGDGLAHVGFAALAIAISLNTAPLIFSVAVVILTAFLLIKSRSKLSGDASIALISSSALAIGIIITSLAGGSNTDISSYMFGSILAMNKADVITSIILAIFVISVYIFCYNKIFTLTFDENFTKASGINTNNYNMLIAICCAITIVIGMRIMGTLLISSLIIFPALTSMRICKTYKSVVITSAFVSVICFFFGILLSFAYSLPAGASVVIINLFAFILFHIISRFKYSM